MASINIDDISKKIAITVSKMILPKVRKMVVEESKKNYVATKKLIREELDKRQLNNVITEHTSKKQNDVSNIDVAKRKIAARSNGKNKAKNILDEHNFFDDENNMVNNLIADTVVPETDDVRMIEGADKSFKPNKLIESHEVEDPANIDPANIDFSAIIDAMETK